MSWYALIVAEDSELKVVKRLGNLLKSCPCCRSKVDPEHHMISGWIAVCDCGWSAEAFIPSELVIASCRRTGMKKKTPSPMIDGYVFVRTPDWDVIKSRVPQVFGPARRDGLPAVLKKADVDRMRMLTCTVTAIQNRHGFKAGDKVRIIRGALKDLQTIVQSIKGQLATITMTALGKEHKVQVNINMVDAV
jgi:transcription antitermination factor NusG